MRAVAVGGDDDVGSSSGGAGGTGSGSGGEALINATAEDVLRSLPGITAKNARYVMNRVRSVKELCTLSEGEVMEMLGSEPGKVCWEFMHRGERK